jgi:hypothetical protein
MYLSSAAWSAPLDRPLCIARGRIERAHVVESTIAASAYGEAILVAASQSLRS